jgi:hypothetical protein
MELGFRPDLVRTAKGSEEGVTRRITGHHAGTDAPLSGSDQPFGVQGKACVSPSRVPSLNSISPWVTYCPVGQLAARKLAFRPARANLRPAPSRNLMTEPAPPAMRGILASM